MQVPACICTKLEEEQQEYFCITVYEKQIIHCHNENRLCVYYMV